MILKNFYDYSGTILLYNRYCKIVTMSSIVMGYKLVEDRLRGSNKDFSYLIRESDTKKGKFILVTLTKSGSSVKHTLAPNPSARKNFQSP